MSYRIRAPWDPSGTPGLTYGVVRTRRYLLPPAARRAFTRLTVWRTDPVVGSGLPSARPGLSSWRATTPGLREMMALATSGARCSQTRASSVAWAVRTLKLATRSAAPDRLGVIGATATDWRYGQSRYVVPDGVLFIALSR